MSDIIRLLPDSIANQIAAGEVIQRPASVVKELLDNAVDAGATDIKVILKDSGKTLIQVQDNGAGMSPVDARMSLERHATSKLRSADDLFDIRTMGFRGEALASIAAIAQLEMRTRRSEDTLGTRLIVENSTVITQESCQCPVGTTIMVKNLFFNVPARRKFLKSDPVEMRHILDEFHHLALAFEEIQFSLHHNNQLVYNLQPGPIRQRILGIFGKKVNEYLVPVEEHTNYVNFSGYIGKPKMARKSRGEQFLFVNKRYIRSPYLQHAVKTAYEDILPDDQFPFYVLFLEIAADKIDINVHPTKQEIKFEDERIVYNYLRVACRHALGKYSITPTLDFDQEVGIERAAGETHTEGRIIAGSGERQFGQGAGQDEIRNWDALLQSIDGFTIERSDVPANVPTEAGPLFSDIQTVASGLTGVEPVQLWNRYIVVPGLGDLMIIDQRAAHERVLFEAMLEDVRRQGVTIQKLLWPETIQLATTDASLLKELLPVLQEIGFDIAEFGHDSFIVHGLPALMAGLIPAQQALEDLLDQFKEGFVVRELKPLEKVAMAFAANVSRRKGEVLTTEEMKTLIEKLWSAENPFASPSGRKTFITFGKEDIFRRFQN